mgnify:FL=1
MIKKLYKKYQILYKNQQKIQQKWDELAEKMNLMDEAIENVAQKLLKKYVNKTESATIKLPEDVCTRYNVDHLTIEENDGQYQVYAYKGENQEGNEVMLPTEIILDVLFEQVKQLYNEI